MDWVLNVGIALTMHMGLSDGYNFLHPYVQAKFDNNVIAGWYYNSEYAVSTYLGYEYVIDENSTVDLGFVTGYKSGPVMPMLKYNYKQFFISPAWESETNNVGAVAGIDWRF